MYVWIIAGRLTPPQHVATITEATVATEAKLREYLASLHSRAWHVRCGGVWETERGETVVVAFTVPERMAAYVARNDIPIIRADDVEQPVIDWDEIAPAKPLIG